MTLDAAPSVPSGPTAASTPEEGVAGVTPEHDGDGGPTGAASRPVTVWELYVKREVAGQPRWSWEHNHLENGHVLTEKPRPIVDCPNQRAWASGTWRRTHAFLDAQSVVKIS